MEAILPGSPTTSIETTAQAHAEDDGGGPAASPTDHSRAGAAQDFRTSVNFIWVTYSQILSENNRLKASVQELLTYGRDVYAKYMMGQRHIAQLSKHLADADELVRRTQEELSRCKDLWEQDSQTAKAAMELLESDREIYKDGAAVLAETIDRKDDEIKRLESEAEELRAKLANQERDSLQMREENEALKKDVAEAQDLLKALETPAEPLGRTVRKKRKM
ncbi:hypothetical protein SEUCBS139899_009125 [Sporothrix eucalyptigena]